MTWFVDTNPAVLCSLIRGPKPHELQWLISLPCGIASTASWRLASPCCWRCPHSLRNFWASRLRRFGEGNPMTWKSTRNRDFTNKDWWMESSSASSCWWIRHSGGVRIIPNQQVSASDGNHLQMDDKCVLEIAYWTIQTGSRFMILCIETPKKNDKNINSIQFLLVVHVNLFETTGYSYLPPLPGPGTQLTAPGMFCRFIAQRRTPRKVLRKSWSSWACGAKQQKCDKIKHLIASDSIWIPRYH